MLQVGNDFLLHGLLELLLNDLLHLRVGKLSAVTSDAHLSNTSITSGALATSELAKSIDFWKQVLANLEIKKLCLLLH